jgi:hypothetical protein
MEKYDIESKRYILHTIKRNKAKRIGHLSRGNFLLKHVIEGEIEERRDITTKKKM